ncbi:MAG: methyltransferase domain-containing protein [Frankiales bacterium]|nr:methyltransferase domain-containing protein [Frankiales bacterium]
MGRFSRPLAVLFADAVGVRPGQRALDVGCGTGALTDVLVERLGVDAVSAADPSASFVAAVRARYPSMEVLQTTAEALDVGTASYDVVLASLAVHFMHDAVRGLGAMARAASADGIVGATVWDHAGGRGPLAEFWSAVRSLDPGARDESHLPGVREGHLAELLRDAGARAVEATALSVEVHHDGFDAWWQPYTLGVGPAGEHVAALDAASRARLEELLRERLPDGPFTTTALAWTAWGAGRG